MSPEGNSNCPACGHDRSLPFGSKGEYSFSVCSECSTIYTSVTEGTHEGSELYDHYYDHATFGLSEAASRSLDQLALSCEGYRVTGNWLDIGFGEGGMLSVAEARGWKCFGTEISGQAIAYGRDRGWTVSGNPGDDSRFPGGGFDVITMIEIIEHLPQPRGSIMSAFELLRPGGLLYLTTPNATSINRRFLGIDWSVFSPPEHITIWSATGVNRLLENAGFAVKRIRTEGLNPKDLMDRWRSATPSGEAAPSRNDVAFALNEVISSTPWRRAVKRGINEALSLARVGDSLKVWAVKPTSTS